jgi:predicted RNase H-like HicB family nuclease
MKSKNMDYTAIIAKTKSGRYIAQCKELPAALTQGNTEEEALENLQDAIDLILKTEKEEKEKVSKGNKFIKRKIAIL